jgi:MFS family permease
MQSLIYAIGNGVFLAGSAVFFLHVVRLSPTQIGIGFSVAGLQSALTSIPLGALADRIGSRLAWMIGAGVQGLLFCAYPFARGFWPFLAILCSITLVSSLENNGRNLYTIEAVPPEDRVRVLAFARSALNIGFSIGALGAGVALAVNTVPAYDSMALAVAGGLLASTLFVARLPRTSHDPAAVRRARAAGGRFGVLRDRPFLAVTALNGLLLSQGTIFGQVMPLWVATRTDAHHVMLAVLFITNTTLAVLLQVPASRGAGTLPGVARVMRWAGLATAACCPVFLLTHFSGGAATVILLMVGVTLVTAGELWQSAGGWGLSTMLPPAANRGAYIGAFSLGGQLQAMVGPASLTYLAIRTGTIGWLVIAALLLGAAFLAKPVVTWAAATPRIGEAVEPVPETVPVFSGAILAECCEDESRDAMGVCTTRIPGGRVVRQRPRDGLDGGVPLAGRGAEVGHGREVQRPQTPQPGR